MLKPAMRVLRQGADRWSEQQVKLDASGAVASVTMEYDYQALASASATVATEVAKPAAQTPTSLSTALPPAAPAAEATSAATAASPFGFLAGLAGAFLWDDAQQEMLVLKVNAEGGLNFFRPDGADKQFVRYATLTAKSRGRLSYMDNLYGEGFELDGRFASAGDLGLEYRNRLISFTQSERFQPTAEGGLRWSRRHELKGTQTNRDLVFVPVRDPARIAKYRDAHIARNIAQRLDTDSMLALMEEAREKERQQDAEKARRKLENDLATIQRQNAIAGVLDAANTIMAGEVARSSQDLQDTLDQLASVRTQAPAVTPAPPSTSARTGSGIVIAAPKAPVAEAAAAPAPGQQSLHVVCHVLNDRADANGRTTKFVSAIGVVLAPGPA
ncbi:MAG: hypothetical protein EOP92_43320, partial [Lysobacteraceae bacterium]